MKYKAQRIQNSNSPRCDVSTVPSYITSFLSSISLSTYTYTHTSNNKIKKKRTNKTFRFHSVTKLPLVFFFFFSFFSYLYTRAPVSLRLPVSLPLPHSSVDRCRDKTCKVNPPSFVSLPSIAKMVYQVKDQVQFISLLLTNLRGFGWESHFFLRREGNQWMGGKVLTFPQAAMCTENSFNFFFYLFSRILRIRNRWLGGLR